MDPRLHDLVCRVVLTRCDKQSPTDSWTSPCSPNVVLPSQSVQSFSSPDGRITTSKEKSTHRELILSCMHCKYETPSKKLLLIHLAKHDSNIKLHRCPICRDVFLKETNLITHKCRPGRIHSCSHCDYQTCLKKEFKLHQALHGGRKSNKVLIHKCGHCNYETPYKKSLLVHRTKHEPNKLIHRCPVCRYVFLKKSTLITHKCRPDKIHSCSHCDYKTCLKKEFKLHWAECSGTSSTSKNQVLEEPIDKSEDSDGRKVSPKLMPQRNVLIKLEEPDSSYFSDMVDVNVSFACTVCEAIFMDVQTLSEHCQKHILKWDADPRGAY